MDGWVTVGTKLDTKQLEKDIKSAENKMKQYEKEAKKLTEQKAKVQLDLSAYEEEKRKIQEATDLTLKQAQTEEQVNFILNQESLEIDNLNQKYSKTFQKNDEINSKIQENTHQQGLLNNEIDEMNSKLNKSKGFNNVTDSIKNAGSETSKTLKKVAKWGLAIFSVRSAYMLVRSAISTISQYNEQLGADVEYIRFAFASMLEPVINRIINLVKTLLQYIQYIVKAWFNVDIFANASAKKFKNMGKSAKEINKQLAGFDEMNVLSDNKDDSKVGPSFDLTKPEDVPIPSWLQWIADNKNLVIGALIGIGTALAGIKIAQFLNSLGLLKPLLNSIFTSVKNLSAIQIVGIISGIILAITGLITTIKAVINFIKDPSWENFNQILIGLTTVLAGVALAMIAFNLTNPVGWIVLAVAAVTGLVAILSSLSLSLFEDKANILDTKEAQEQLTEAIDKTREATENHKNALDDYDNALKNADDAAKALEQAEKKNKISGEELARQVADGTLKYENMTDAQKEVYKAYYNNKVAQDNLKEATDTLETSTENLTKAKEEEKRASWENELAIAKEGDSYDNFKKKIIEAYEKGELSAAEARDYIERATADMSTANSKTFTKDIPDAIKDGLDTKHYQSAWTKLKNGFSDLWNGIKSSASSAWGKVKSIFGFSKGGVVFNPTGFAKGGVVGFANGGIAKPIKCAKGSIISQPGRGVPIARAIGGEAGAEGIIPLTDSQMMSQLGEAIGKYININLTNITKLDNRQIAREQKRINAQNDFTFNR